MTRSKGRTNRIARLAGAAAILVGIGLTSACSAGQLAQTSEIVPAIPGGSLSVSFATATNPNEAVKIQDATINFKADGYKAGADAPLTMRIINQTTGTVTITPTSAVLQAPTAATEGNGQSIGKPGWSSAAYLAALTQASAAATSAASPSPSGSTPATPGTAASASPAPSQPPAPQAPADLKIASNGIAILDSSADQYVQISGLTHPLQPGDVVNVTFDITETGPNGTRTDSGTVAVTFAPPTTAQSWGPSLAS